MPFGKYTCWVHKTIVTNVVNEDANPPVKGGMFFFLGGGSNSAAQNVHLQVCMVLLTCELKTFDRFDQPSVCSFVGFCVREDPPYFVFRPLPLYQRHPGQSVTMPCAADGDPKPTIAWRKVCTMHKIVSHILVRKLAR